MRAIVRAARPRSMRPLAPPARYRNAWRSGSRLGASAAGSVMDAGRRQRCLLQLLGQLQRALSGPARGRLRLRRVRQPQQERAPELVVIALVRLDHVAIEGGGLGVADAV